MNISAISPNQIHTAAMHPTQAKPAREQRPQPPQDRVELSAQAKASLDIDHHGDTH